MTHTTTQRNEHKQKPINLLHGSASFDIDEMTESIIAERRKPENFTQVMHVAHASISTPDSGFIILTQWDDYYCETVECFKNASK